MWAVMSAFSKKLEALAIENGCAFIQHTEFHIQIKGVHIVNVYESKQTYFVNGAAKKAYFNTNNPMSLIKIALGESNAKVSSEKENRKSFSKAKKENVKNRNDRCWICGELFTGGQLKTIEHKVPLDKGGSNRIDNLAVSHDECNRIRKNSLGKK